MNWQAVLMGMLLIATCAHSAVTEMAVKITGPRSVYRGSPLQLQVKGIVVRGTDTDLITVYLNRLPAGMTSSWLRGCCSDTTIWRVDYLQVLIIKTDQNAPLGRQSITIVYATPGGVRGEATYYFDVLEVPTASTPTNPIVDLTLPAESTWRQHILKGNAFCYQDFVGEAAVWYYDGARVYYNLNEIAGNQSFNSCAEYQNTAYRRYVTDSQGFMPGWRYFPRGLGMHYQKTGDASSLRALRLMLNSPWATTNMASLDPISMREVAYALQVHLENERRGLIRQPDFGFIVESLIGHFEMLFFSRQAQWQPFIVGLASEALIDYWEISKDPRVLPILTNAADIMWRESWNIPKGAFAYYLDSGPPTYDGAADANLLIAPLYGWLYQQTHEEIFRTRGDMIFSDGVAGAWLDGGKQFSQNYRWSNRYIEFRRKPATTPTIPNPPPASPPAVKSLTPNNGTGTSQMFSLTVEEPTGAQSLRQILLTVDASNKSAASCALSIAPKDRTVSLLNDAGNNTGAVSVDAGGVLQNSQCSVTLSSLSIVLAGNMATLQIPLSFRPAFAGLKNLYLSATNAAMISTGTLNLGTYSVTQPAQPGPPASQSPFGPPVIQSVTATPNTGFSKTFTIVVDESTGARNLQFISLTIDSAVKKNASCAFDLILPSQSVTLRNDAGTASQYGVFGSPNPLANRQCSIVLSSIVVTTQARRVTAELTVNFDLSYRGSKTIFVNAGNVLLKDSGVTSFESINIGAGAL